MCMSTQFIAVGGGSLACNYEFLIIVSTGHALTRAIKVLCWIKWQISETSKCNSIITLSHANHTWCVGKSRS